MKKIKMPNAFVTLFIIIFIVAVLTWIIPAGQYEYVDPNASRLQPIAGTYSRAEQTPQGLGSFECSNQVFMMQQILCYFCLSLVAF